MFLSERFPWEWRALVKYSVNNFPVIQCSLLHTASRRKFMANKSAASSFDENAEVFFPYRWREAALRR
jgi:hypothetical protein